MMNSMKRPLVKDMNDYFRNPDNWVVKWESELVNLRIDKLKHTGITRLVHTNVKSDYVGRHDVIITYSMYDKKGDDPWLGEYLDRDPNQNFIRDCIKNQWTEDVE